MHNKKLCHGHSVMVRNTHLYLNVMCQWLYVHVFFMILTAATAKETELPGKAYYHFSSSIWW